MSERQISRTPVHRKLRVFAVDPGMTAATINEVTLAVRWEELEPGPVGEYVAVVDSDQAGEALHEPVDLDARHILAQSGLVPSDGNPQFRQQMVYAVAMRTIASFERGLGRPVHWQPDPGGAYRRQLSMRPHFVEEANAYYSPAEGICFGYFAAADDALLPGTVVFTCLSQDVIAHQVTHAVLAGMGVGFEGSDKGDDAALHEAFADLVALFQHFDDSHVLRTQVAAVRGDLLRRSLLGAVAPQFGRAMPNPKPDGLRNALGVTDAKGRWRPRRPDPTLYPTTIEPHARGDILVAALFGAFHAIYEARVTDLRRLASRGTGVLAKGELHPDLVGRLTREARRSAAHVLQMCIRALDYLPPVDVTFSDLLRAVVTADFDVVPPDDRHYRIAFVEAFRSYGIVPPEVRTLSTDTLLWSPPPDPAEATVVLDFVKELADNHTYWNLPSDRRELWETIEQWKHDLTERLTATAATYPRIGPIEVGKPFEIRTLELRDRAETSTELTLLWVIKIVQEEDGSRRGCTLLIDAEQGRVRYRIDKPAPDRGDDLLAQTTATPPPPPRERMLRVFAFDPSLGVEIGTAGINEVTLAVPWERDGSGADILQPGPVGEYLEVIDHDPASGCFYAPVDLNDERLLAQDGLTPSESNPQFHQQMVYAVAMRTIRQFELALGRLALWAPEKPGEEGEAYVQRLRVHPHALREANAYYSPARKALLFGYFSAPGAGGGGVTVFTSLSHDIVAHEVTHALLDGIHRRFNEASNPDVLAFHEAFADLVALFQHFSLPEVLRHQIAYTRGDLESQNRLGELAQQFGQAIGNRGALRSALGGYDEEAGEWRPIDPDPEEYERRTEPHERGAILVAAVFGAFLSIYKVRAADLLRIATEGTGELPPGQLHPDLVDRLADEAATAARRVLHMCIRALDYCPPVDITFGEYLRALVTADYEHDPVDAEHRRVAFAESFRRYGIVPENVRTLSVDGLLWRPESAAYDDDVVKLVVSKVRKWAVDLPSWNLTRDRRELYQLMEARRAELHSYLRRKLGKGGVSLRGIDLSGNPRFEVHSLRPALGNDAHGRPRLNWVVELTQSEAQWLDEDGERDGRPPDYIFRNGTTLIIDARTGEVRYGIRKPPDDARRARQREFLLDEGSRSLAATYFGGPAREHAEPFAMLHRL